MRKILSLSFLIAINAVPLYGVIYLDWSLFLLLASYWLDSIVLGIFTIIKILQAQGKVKTPVRVDINRVPHFYTKNIDIMRAFLPFFFIFTFLQGLVIFLVFAKGENIIYSKLLYFLLLSFLSHLSSYFYNFRANGEYMKNSPDFYLNKNMSVLAIMHMMVWTGAFTLDWIGTPILGLWVFIIIRTAMDLYRHLNEHRISNKPQDF